jgi:ATP phosphoribosyltransferase regulatory subunit HisZ
MTMKYNTDLKFRAYVDGINQSGMKFGRELTD